MKRLITKQEIISNEYIVINGKVYNIKGYINQHPGGEFILQNLGRDCTYIFNSTHNLNTINNINKILSNDYFIGYLDPESRDDIYDKYSSYYNGDYLDQEYIDLKMLVDKYFKDNNIKKRDNVQMYIQVIFALVLYFASFYYFFIMNGSIIFFIIHILAKILVTFGIMHDANHGAISNNWKVNNILSYTLNIIGGSVKYWRYKHNIVHHNYTNSDLDDDKVLPFKRLDQINNSKFNFIIKYILYLFTPLESVLGELDINKMRPFAYSYIVPLILFLFQYMLIFISSMSIIKYNFYFILGYAIFGYIGSFLFGVNHMVEDSMISNKDQNWTINQINTSSNYSSGSHIVNYFTGGLNHQIEHHLFPSICHIHYPAISRIVKKYCLENNIRYTNFKNIYEGARKNYEFIKKLSK